MTSNESFATSEDSSSEVLVERCNLGGEMDLEIELRKAARLLRIETASGVAPEDGLLSWRASGLASRFCRFDGRESMMGSGDAV